MSDFIAPKQVQDQFGLKVGHLRKMRHDKKGPPYYKPTERIVLYKESEVRAYIEQTRVAQAAAA